MKTNKLIKGVALAGGMALFTVSGARAFDTTVQQTWTGAVDNVWDTTTFNWSGSAWVNNNSAIFNSTTDQNIVLVGEIAVSGTNQTALIFNSAGRSYTFSGATLASNNNANLIFNINNNTVTFNNFINNTNTNDFRWSVGATGTLNYNGGASTTGVWELGYGGTNGTINFTKGNYTSTAQVRMNSANINVTGTEAMTLSFNHMQTRSSGAFFTVNNPNAVMTLAGNAENNYIGTNQLAGTLRLVSGTVTYGNNLSALSVSNNAGAMTGLLKVEGGSFTVNGGDGLVLVNNNGNNAFTTGTGKFVQTGGVVSVSGITFTKRGNDTALGGGPVGVVQISGGELYVGSNGIKKTNRSATAADVGTPDFEASGGVIGASANWASDVDMRLTGNVTFKAAGADNVAHNITLNNALSGAGGFTKTGAGTLILNGAGSLGGNVVVDAGTIQLGSASTLTVGTVVFNLNGANTGSITGNGALTLDAIAFDMANASGNSWDMSGIFGAALAVNYTTGFNISGWATSDGNIWTSGDNLYSFDVSSGILSYSTIPEPSTLALLLTGAALLAVLRKRR